MGMCILMTVSIVFKKTGSVKLRDNETECPRKIRGDQSIIGAI